MISSWPEWVGWGWQIDRAVALGQKKTEGTGVGVVLWVEVTGVAGTEGVRITVGFGVFG